MKLEQLREPGPARAAAVAAIARELRMGLSMCADRARPLASRMLDLAIAAAEEAG